MIGQRFDANGAHFAFTDRWGGVSAVPYVELNLGGAVGTTPKPYGPTARAPPGPSGSTRPGWSG